jgi:hypothetical protein
MTSGIFVLDDKDALHPMKEEAFTSEDLFQGLLAQYPNLMPGEQIDPAMPRRWLLISRETAIASEENGAGRWSVDHLFLDQDGIPTLVEVKRSSDTRLRREVVGQLLEYAANAVVYWSQDQVREAFDASCQATGRNPDGVLADFLGEAGDPAAFWMTVKTNLQAGKVRLIFLADVIPSELQRIVEFLNQQMSPAEVLAVEIRRFAGGSVKTLVSRVIGQTTAAQAKRGTLARQEWTEERFMTALGEAKGQELVTVAQALLEWSRRNCDIYWGKGEKTGSFSPRVIEGGEKHQLFVVWTNGIVNVYFDVLARKSAFAEIARRRELQRRLQLVPGVSIGEAELGGLPSIRLSILKEPASLAAFLSAFDWAIKEIRSGSGRTALPRG